MSKRRLPRRLYRYIGVEILTTFCLSLTALTLLFTIVVSLKGVSHGLGMSTVLAWVIGSLGQSFFFTVPVALLLAGTLTYGRMVAEREYTAITASGLSPLHLFTPMSVLAGVLTLIAYISHGTVLPDAHYSQNNIGRFLIKQLQNLGDQRDKRIPLGDGGEIYFREVQDGRFLKGIQIKKSFKPSDFKGAELQSGSETTSPDEDRELPLIVHAEYATIDVGEDNKIYLGLDGVQVKLADKNSILFDEVGWSRYWHGLAVSHHTLEFDLAQRARRQGDLHNADLLAELENLRQERIGYQNELDNAETPEAIAEKQRVLDSHDRRIRGFEAEYWQRKALVFSIFAFAFLSFPISLVLRYQHRLVSLFGGVVVVLTVFYPLLLLGDTLAEELGIPSAVAMLSGDVALLALATYLTGKVLVR